MHDHILENENRELRFQKLERVVCNVGPEWLSGTIMSLKEPTPGNESVKVPYVVKLDAPHNKLISVPSDDNSTVRTEVCFGQTSDGLQFTLFCLPQIKSKPTRFVVGERVTCAVEDGPLAKGSVWAAGTVTAIEVSLELPARDLLPEKTITDKWQRGIPYAPYEVELDAGGSVLVHKDAHWLIRDYELQSEGPRQAEGGVRCLERIQKRKTGDSWEIVDHMTRRKRQCDPPDEE